MKKKERLHLFLILIVFLAGFAFGAIPVEERAALIALYNSTNGDNWNNNSGWKEPPLHTDGFSMPGTENTGYGITISDDHVTKIVLYSNQLIGNISSELRNLINLEYLELYSNQLTGSIPLELGNLSNLTKLWLQNNQLEGSIPVKLGNLTNLTDFRLDNNQLTGSIPPELGNLSNLQFLYIFSNHLTGCIPAELGNLSSLEYLRLDNNQLGDAIPTNLMNLKNLIALNIRYNCLYANDPELIVWLDDYDPNWGIYQDRCTSTPPEIRVNRKRLNLGYVIGSNNLPIETFSITNPGGGTLNWNVRSESQWMVLNPISGTNDGIVEVTIDPVGLTPGKYEGVIEVSDPFATNSPVEVIVTLQVKDKTKISPPFGDFATPINGSTVRSIIPVTGWTLGDTGIDSVKVYRTEGKNLVYIGDGVFIEGARPDVEAAYPDYPMNYKAGWGYMMLTNSLPNRGNGTFKIHAIATDKEGQTTTLGIKTITVDNANAVKPFGAIDTPTQGGTASGSNFIKWGWVLTPQPNNITTNGSTITVYVNGVNLGHPAYNLYREDIAYLFPGYANSNGAAGCFYLDTTVYENGVHTIQWVATDSTGNTDGIGSRYFTIQNTGCGVSQMSSVIGQKTLVNEELSSIHIDYSEPVKVRKGYYEDIALQEIYPDDSGVLNIEIKELERVEFRFEGTMGLAPLSTYTGFLVIDRHLRALPIGSTLDTQRGVFSWQPGPGFYGTYEFVFLETDGIERRKVRVRVKISPKHPGLLE